MPPSSPPVGVFFGGAPFRRRCLSAASDDAVAATSAVIDGDGLHGDGDKGEPVWTTSRPGCHRNRRVFFNHNQHHQQHDPAGLFDFSCPIKSWVANVPVFVLLVMLLSLQQIAAMESILPLRSIVGQPAILPCFINTTACGDVHNIKWYKNGLRVYLFSPLANIHRSEGYLARQGDRTGFFVNSTPSYLRLVRTLPADEGLYRCDVTYMQVREHCVTMTLSNLSILEPAAPPEVSLDLRDILNGSTIGPINEGDLLNLTCRSRKGRPLPEVSWWNGWTKLSGQTVHSVDGLLMNGGAPSNSLQQDVPTQKQALNFLRLEITRKYLNSTLQCRVQNDALPEPLISSFKLDIHVRPLTLELNGAQSPVTAGTAIRLVCAARAARPPATLTWLNGSTPLQPQPHAQTAPAGDGTYTTQSMLSFTATHLHNGVTISCLATNRVLQEKKEEPLLKAIAFEVRYPPLVTLAPEGNLTVQEGESATLTCAYVSNPRQITGKRWLRDDKPLRLSPSQEIMDGVADQMKLVFHNITRVDQGVYACQVRNAVGTGISAETFTLDVQYPPEVSTDVLPRQVVEGRTAVRLRCTVVAGNPSRLDQVQWYKDGAFVNDTTEPELVLGTVTRAADGNYSCRGRNRLGWSDISPERSLTVTYPPGPALLRFAPEIVIKRRSVTLTCSVEDPGKPSKIQYRWSRGQRVISEVVSGTWTIEPVTLETRGNFTCMAVNEVGGGGPATVHINVYAPPSFIDRLPHYYGALMTSSYVNMSCRVECDPLCTMHWLKNGVPIANSRYYTISTSMVGSDSSTDDFQSVMSTLIWNLAALPGGRLDRHGNNANYTCSSSDNLVGPGVTSTAYFRVEYPPENITVSTPTVDVVEGDTPSRVRCRAYAYPDSSYRWRHHNHTVGHGEVLQLPSGISREHSGLYTCVASNRHGNVARDTLINVLYKPECRMYQRPDPTGLITLICEALANPPRADFAWVLDNVTLDEAVRLDGLHSVLSVPNNPQYYGTYYCTANNSLGSSTTCVLDISGTLGWLETLGDDSIMKVSAAIGGVIILILAVCGVIILMIRCRRAPGKYSSSVELEERDSIEGPMQLVEPIPPSRTMIPADRSHSQLLKYPSLEITTQDMCPTKFQTIPEYHSSLPIRDRHRGILWPS